MMYPLKIMNDTYNYSTTYNPYKESNIDIDYLKREVGLRFPIKETRNIGDTAVFYVMIDKESSGEQFDSLRKIISSKGYIPILRKEKDEHIIYITKKPKRKEKPMWVNAVLLIATIITTTLTGSLLHIGYGDLQSVPNLLTVISPENLFFGTIYFSLPLLSILFIHEMGHYFVSKKHGIHTSLPYFLPIPPILPGFNIGTFGALISSHDPMPNKKALFDVGISGPLAGFLIALPVTIIGILTSSVIQLESYDPSEIYLNSSLLFSFLIEAIMDIPQGYALDLNPIAFAGWIGLFITSINLLPAGQLDGGHIFRAILGDKQKYAGWIAVFILIFSGLWFFAIIIVTIIGLNHPPPLNDEGSVDLKRKLLFFAAVAILILCYIPYPFYIPS